jgi:photosystem II stability/assembly factor-like uncharacterized protein
VEPVSFDEALVLCQEGEVFRTTDSGVSWEPAGSAPGAAALAVVDGAPVVAVIEAEGCDGVAVGPLDTDSRVCVDGAPASPVSLSFAGSDAGFLVAAGTTYVSGDGGSTWRQV